jgi:DNA polymerase-3 subunit delta
MKLTRAQAEHFVGSPDPSVRAILIYGPNTGLVSERARAVIHSLVESPDPFNLVEYSSSRIAEQPSLLWEEITLYPLGGGKRVVHIRNADDGVARIASDVLLDGPTNAYVVLEGGDLPRSSTLRKLFEAETCAAAIACYHDESENLGSLIRDALAKDGFRVTQEAIDYLSNSIGTDRLAIYQEIEKIRVFAGLEESNIDIEDVLACVASCSSYTQEDVCLALADGNNVALDRSLGWANQRGDDAVSSLRAVSRHLQRLHFVKCKSVDRRSIDSALASLKPQVFWKVRDRFKAQVIDWSTTDLAFALSWLLREEIARKRDSTGDWLSGCRTLSELAQIASTSSAPRPGGIERTRRPGDRHRDPPRHFL